MVFLCLGALILSGCSTKPTYYSKSDVKKYIKRRFDQPKIIEQLSYEDNTYEQNMMYEYRIRDKHGVEFSVYCSTSHTRFDASTTIFYEKNIRNDYVDSVFELKKEKINSLISKFSLGTEENPYGIEFFIENEQDISLVAQAISELDNLLDVHYRDDDMDINAFFSFKSVDDEEDFSRVGSIPFSNGQSERLNKEDVQETIEQLATDYAKKYDTDFGFSDGLMAKYDAPILQVYIEDQEIQDVQFKRYEGAYWIYTLDICQDFEDSSYEQTNSGIFARLVNAAGGQYRCDDYQANWKIGEDEWHAKLKINKDLSYRTLYVWKNGKKLSLSSPKDLNTTTPGTKLSLDDLSLLLKKEYKIDQKNKRVIFQ